MKRWYYLVLGGVLIACAGYIYFHRQELGLVSNTTPADTSAPDNSLPPARVSWTTVDRAQDGFKADMPEGSRETKVPAYEANGGSDQVEMLYAYPDASTSYSIAWEDDPPVLRAAGGDPQQTLNAAQDGVLARTRTVLVTEAESTRQGYVVRDFTSRNQGGGVLNARLILVGRRLYMLIAAFPAVSARNDADVNHFFNSFTVVGGSRIRR